MHDVLLVPGFFGFANLGDLTYFAHIREILVDALARQGITARIRPVRTLPTSSLRRRAARVIEVLAEEPLAEHVHLIGHSSGGLDLRLVTTPGVSLPTDHDVEKHARRVRTVVTVATPHHGTPVADFFASFLGHQLLKVFSLTTIYALRTGRLPLSVVLRLLRFFARPDQPPGPAATALDQLYRQLLADFSPDRRREIEEFFGQVGHDQDLLGQLTPAGMDVYNATTRDRPGVRYGCVVTRARPPGLRSAWAAGFSPYAQATHALYVALYRLAARMPADRVPVPTTEQADVLRAAYGRLPDGRDNDGIVPTLSQLHGTIVHAARADHLDVVGHFDLPTHVPPHFDWLTTGSGFSRPGFERLWGDVAGYLAGHAVAAKSRRWFRRG